MARNMKVYGGLTFIDGKQLRTIVATSTKKRAMEILDESNYSFNNYWSETSNKVETEIALKEPNTIFVASTSTGFDFVKYQKMTIEASMSKLGKKESKPRY